MTFDQERACVMERVLAGRIFAMPEEVALEWAGAWIDRCREALKLAA
jgi:hypothetical protein